MPPSTRLERLDARDPSVQVVPLCASEAMQISWFEVAVDHGDVVEVVKTLLPRSDLESHHGLSK